MRVLRLGVCGYREAWDRQLELVAEVQSGADDTLVLVEHPPVMTLGASFHREHLVLSPDEYAAKGIDVVTTDRGGDVTFHGPGQLVAYPIFDLQRHGRDLHRWMRDLEEVFLRSCGTLGVSARRFPPHTGVWVADRKVAAIGVKVKRWVSLHGVALNCDNSLDEFGLIVPCGIKSHGVTSLSIECGRRVTVAEAESVVTAHFAAVFGLGD